MAGAFSKRRGPEAVSDQHRNVSAHRRRRLRARPALGGEPLRSRQARQRRTHVQSGDGHGRGCAANLLMSALSSCYELLSNAWIRKCRVDRRTAEESPLLLLADARALGSECAYFF